MRSYLKKETEYHNYHTATKMTHSKGVPDLLGQALQFRVANDQPIGVFSADVLGLQFQLIMEEYGEFCDAYTKAVMYNRNMKSREHALKELADLVYVCYQFATAVGWELDEALARVHTSNMSKLVNGKPLKDEHGKVKKGPNYQPPFLEDLV